MDAVSTRDFCLNFRSNIILQFYSHFPNATLLILSSPSRPASQLFFRRASGVRSGPLFCRRAKFKGFLERQHNKLALRERQWRAQQASQTLSGCRPPSTNKHQHQRQNPVLCCQKPPSSAAPLQGKALLSSGQASVVQFVCSFVLKAFLICAERELAIGYHIRRHFILY